MPAVNGKMQFNNAVSLDSDIMGSKVDTVDWKMAYRAENPELYAQTGTYAIQRKPLVRVWNDIGNAGYSDEAKEYYLATEGDRRQLNIHVENRYWMDYYAFNAAQSITTDSGSSTPTFNDARYDTYATKGGSKGDLVLPVVTTVLPYGIAPLSNDTGMPYEPLENQEQVMPDADWSMVYSPNSTVAHKDQLAGDDKVAKQGFRATVTYELVDAVNDKPDEYEQTGPVAKQWRYVVRFTAVGNDSNNQDGNIVANNIASSNTSATTGNSEQRIASGAMGTFKFNIATYAETIYTNAEKEAGHEEAFRTYENIRTYVSSKMSGYKFLSDHEIEGDRYQVGSRAYYPYRNESDDRLDARDGGEQSPARGTIPYNSVNVGNATNENVPTSYIPGFVGTYVESEGTSAYNWTTARTTTLDLGGLYNQGLLVEDYSYRPSYGLSFATTQGLNGNTTTARNEKYGNRVNEFAVPDMHVDAGSFAALKTYTGYPSLTVYYQAEKTPIDRPSDAAGIALGASQSTGTGADKGYVIDSTGVVRESESEDVSLNPWEYDDHLWFSARAWNGVPGLTALGSSGPLLHGKLVYAFHLPKGVSFYDEAVLTSGDTSAEEFMRNLADYTGDDYNFYIERTYHDRHNNDALVTERLTPKQLVDRGWTIEFKSSKNWKNDNFSDPDYGKADLDDPTDEPSSDQTKSYSHEGEIVVVEVAPPNDATDEEFDRNENMIQAYWLDRIHPDGYFGAGDEITVKLRTRIDNVNDDAEDYEELQKSLYDENGKELSYQEKFALYQQNTWEGEESNVYLTTHESAMQWTNDWKHTYSADYADPSKAGQKAVKQVRPAADSRFSVKDFSEQSADRFYFNDPVFEDMDPYDEVVTIPPVGSGLNPGDVIHHEGDDFDIDKDYTDVFTNATSGSYRVAQPSASIRLDTYKLRTDLSDPYTKNTIGEDSHQKAENVMYVTQAINTGSAVNSFIVDWQVPFWATARSTRLDAPFSSTINALGETQPNLQTITTGRWEIPDGIENKAEIEQALRVYLAVRVADNEPSHTPQNGYKNSGFFEQNGTEWIDRENYALAGTDADRDYVYGEDDISDPNFADSDTGTWVAVGNANGYAITDNAAVDIEAALPSGAQVKQVRWIIKAGSANATVQDDARSHEIPVPHGFRLDVDAIPQDDSTAHNSAISSGKQEADEVDPSRENIGWQLEKDENGNFYKRSKPDPNNPFVDIPTDDWEIRSGTVIPSTITNNALRADFQTFVLKDPVIRDIRSESGYDSLTTIAARVFTQAAQSLGFIETPESDPEVDGEEIDQTSVLPLADGEDENKGNPVTQIVHLNHFASATLRYDDTKFVSPSRDRAGFFRDPEYPMLSIEMQQSYFSGSAATGYSWTLPSESPVIDKDASRMLKYTVVLHNLSNEQWAALGGADIYTEDYCTNPNISSILPFIEGFGPAAAMTDKNFAYVPWDDPKRVYMDAGYVTEPTYTEIPEYDDQGNPVYELAYDEKGDPILDENGNQEFVYITDESGNLVLDEQGNPQKKQKVFLQSNNDAANLDTSDCLWSWHEVVYADDLKSYNHIDNSGDPYSVTMNNPKIGGSFNLDDKLSSIDAESKVSRKFFSWAFTGSQDENGDNRNGRLEPGHAIVLEFMMPIDQAASAGVSRELLTATGFIGKWGNFKDYTPEKQSSMGSIATVRDNRDANLDNNTNQTMISMELASLSFKSNEAVQQYKYSKTDTTNKLSTRNIQGPGAAAEGSDYQYYSRATNTSNSTESSRNYTHTVFYDVLPFMSDTFTVEALTDGTQRSRNSYWNGWIDDLNSIAVQLYDPFGMHNAMVNRPAGVETERYLNLDEHEAEIWVGPYNRRVDGSLTPMTEQEILVFNSDPEIRDLKGSARTKMNAIFTDLKNGSHDSADLRAAHMIPLSELKAACEKASPDDALKLKKGLRAIWAQVSADNFNVPPQGYFQLTYHMHTPLNLPKYLGNTTGSSGYDMDIDSEHPDQNTDMAKRLAQTSQWNSFIQRINRNGASGDANAGIEENALAGVFVDAPAERGYIGDYVWIDPDWNTNQDDTEGEVAKDYLGRDTTYHKGANGRWTFATDKDITPDGKWAPFYRQGVDEQDAFLNGTDAGGDKTYVADKFKDVNFDGVTEDPGINGVKVELLNEAGVTVNKDGVPSVFVDDEISNGPFWAVADENGKPWINDAYDKDIYEYSGGPAVSFTTESDYYDNKGYYILSDLAPGKYKLRFTFPEEYSSYSVTTKEIGPDDAKVRLQVTREDGKLIATTMDSIEVKPVEYTVDNRDPEHFPNGYPYLFAEGKDDPVHDAYDARMTSYDVGIAKPVIYEGTVFRDDLLEDLDATGKPTGNPPIELDPTEIDSIMDTYGDSNLRTGHIDKRGKEVRLDDCIVTVYEYDRETQTLATVPAYDADGISAIGSTLDPSNPANQLTPGLAQMVTGADGHFSFRLIPGKSYVVTVKDNQSRMLKPTLVTWADDPTEYPQPALNEHDNDLYVEKGVLKARPFTATIPLDAAGIAIFDTATTDEPMRKYDYQHQDKIDLGLIDGTKGYIGNRVWNDANNDGLQEADESGVDGVKVKLEQYYYDPDDTTWKAVSNQTPLKFDISGTKGGPGQYLVRDAKTYVVDPYDTDPNKTDDQKRKYLAGYRLRIDAADLQGHERDWGITLRNATVPGQDMTEEDSDLFTAPVQAEIPNSDGTRPLTYYFNTIPSTQVEAGVGDDGYIIVAEPITEENEDNVAEANKVTVGSKSYDISSALRLYNFDAGLIEVPRADTEGRVWDDTAGYDGVQDADTTAEPGIPDQEVRLTQWYFDPNSSTWVRNDAFGTDNRTSVISVDPVAPTATRSVDADGKGYISVLTDTDGNYCFESLPAAYMDVHGNHYVASYRVELAALADGSHTASTYDDGEWLLTLYHQGSDVAVDSDIQITAGETGGIAITAREATRANGAVTRAENGQIILAEAIDDASVVTTMHNHVRIPTAQAMPTDRDKAANGMVAYDWLKVETETIDGQKKAVAHDGGDVGEVAPPMQTIAGTLWQDYQGNVVSDYDGLLDDTEPRLAGKDVHLIQWTFDRATQTWTDPVDFATVTTNAAGVYTFEHVPVTGTVTSAAGTVGNVADRILYGYTLEVVSDGAANQIPGLPATMLQVQTPTQDEKNSKAQVVAPSAVGLGTVYPIAWKEINEQAVDGNGAVIKSVFDGKLVLAGKADTTLLGTHTPYQFAAGSFAFDAATGQDELRMHAGFGLFGASKIQGVMWDDANYDGLRNFQTSIDTASPTVGGDPESPIVGATMKLTQYYLDADNAGAPSWIQVPGFTRAATTDAEGVYTFDGLPSFIGLAADGSVIQPDDFAALGFATNEYRLVSYCVELDKRDEVISTRYHAAASAAAMRYDSDLANDATDASLYEQYLENGAQRDDGYIIVAAQAASGATDQYRRTYAGVLYDSVRPIGLQRGGDAGTVEIPTATLSGIIWNDDDYDGVRADDEARMAGEQVRVTQWCYDSTRTNPDDGMSHWFRMTAFGDTDGSGASLGYKTTTTDGQGIYTFADLPTAVVLDGDEIHLAAYRVELADVRVERDTTTGEDVRWVLTRPQVGSDEAIDSDALREDNRGATNGIKLTGRNNATVEEQVVLAATRPSFLPGTSLITVETSQTNPSIPATYDWRAAVDCDGIDAGELDSRSRHVIEGVIWLDENGDGIQNESSENPKINGMAVQLERYIYEVENKTWVNDPSWNPASHIVRTQSGTIAGQAHEGVYRFDNLTPVDHRMDGTNRLYGYRVKVVEDQIFSGDLTKRNFFITRYRQGVDTTKDSDLREKDGYLLDIDRGEVIVLLDTLDDATAALSQPSNLLHDVPMLFTDATGAPTNAQTGRLRTFDIALGRDEAYNDAGLREPPTNKIGGTLWLDTINNTERLDTDYDGFITNGELTIPGKTVYMKQWILTDDGWIEDMDGARTTTTDGNGHYEFDDLKVCVPTSDGFRLLGYTLEVKAGTTTDAINGSPVTLYQRKSPEMDSTNSKALALTGDYDTTSIYTHEGYPVKWTEECSSRSTTAGGKQTLDGRIILARTHYAGDGLAESYAYTTERNNTSYSYDLLSGDDEMRMNAGFVPFIPQKASQIQGVVWEDANGDGKRSFKTSIDATDVPEGTEASVDEQPIEGEQLRLTQYVQTEQGGWEQRGAFNGTGEMLTQTDSEGVYAFTDLPSYVGVAHDDQGREVIYDPESFDLVTMIITGAGDIVGGDAGDSGDGTGGTAGDGADNTGNGLHFVKELRLVSYRVEIVNTETNLSTRHHVASADVRYDSDYDATVDPADHLLYEQYVDATGATSAATQTDPNVRADGVIIVASPALDETLHKAAYKGIEYDLPRALDSERGGDAGFVRTPPRNTISGVFWQDGNVDGIRSDDEAAFAQAEVILHRYLWNTSTRSWDEQPDAMMTTKPNNEGYWEFTDLPLTDIDLLKISDPWSVYGYTIEAKHIPDTYAFTLLNQGDDPSRDSDLDSITMDYDLDNPIAGKIILADEAMGGEDTRAIMRGPENRTFTALTGKDSTGNDVGVVPFATSSISGNVWEDGDFNGVREDDEMPVAGVPVVLNRYWWNGYGWTFDRTLSTDPSSPNASISSLADEASGEQPDIPSNNSDLATDYAVGHHGAVMSNENGYWEFTGLPVAQRMQNLNGTYETRVFGYRVNVADIPQGYEVTADQQAEDPTRDSDLDETNTRLVSDELHNGVIVLMNQSDERPAQDVHVTGPESKTWDAYVSKSSTFNDAGLVPLQRATIDGKVWNDQNADGVQDEASTPVPGQTVILQQRVASGSNGDTGTRTSDGKNYSDLNADGEPLEAADRIGLHYSAASGDELWRDIDRQTVGDDGAYRFTNLPRLTDEGAPYEYRVMMAKPDGAVYIPVGASADDNLDNDWGTLDPSLGENMGSTAALPVAGQMHDKITAYGATHSTFGATEWNRVGGHAVDLGISIQGNEHLAKTGDMVVQLFPILASLMVLSGLVIVFTGRRRKKEESSQMQ